MGYSTISGNPAEIMNAIAWKIIIFRKFRKNTKINLNLKVGLYHYVLYKDKTRRFLKIETSSAINRDATFEAFSWKSYFFRIAGKYSVYFGFSGIFSHYFYILKPVGIFHSKVKSSGIYQTPVASLHKLFQNLKKKLWYY